MDTGSEGNKDSWTISASKKKKIMKSYKRLSKKKKFKIDSRHLLRGIMASKGRLVDLLKNLVQNSLSIQIFPDRSRV